ncbi:MAG: type IV secretion system DNA-binding domain-containing protein [Verrucomicrobiota bacterium]
MSRKQKYDHPAKRELVTGASGTGKTTFFEKLLRGEKARLKLVFDHQGEFSDRFNLPAVVDFEGLYKAVSIGGWVVFDPIKLINSVDSEGRRLGIAGAFDVFCEQVFMFATETPGRKILICDELQKVTDTNKGGDHFLNCLETGRRYELDFMGISQAPNLIHNRVRNQLTKIFAFRLTDVNALRFLKDNSFDDQKIRNLPNGKYVWRNLNSGEAGEGGKAF